MTTRFDAGRLAGTVMAMTLLASAPAIAGFDEAAAAFAVGDYDKALEEIRPLADQGDPRGQYAMGVLYENGFAVAREWDGLVVYDTGDYAEEGAILRKVIEEQIGKKPIKAIISNTASPPCNR